jgi:exosortase/archaeosortase family protein
MLADPSSFGLVWFVGREVGRAGFVFVFFLVAWDFLDSRNQFSLNHSTWRYLCAATILIAMIAFYSVNVFDPDPVRVYVTSQLGVSLNSPLSFLLALEFFSYAFFVLIITGLLYSTKTIPLMSTSVIYSVGTGILATLDAYFPQNALPPLQGWVPLVWNLVVLLLRLFGFHVASLPSPAIVPHMVAPNCPVFRGLPYQTPPGIAWVNPNVLCIWGFKGFSELVIFWPSSGIVSMIIYSLVIVVLIVKLQAPVSRKLVYALVGAVGTFFVNVIRITTIVLYATYYTAQSGLIDAFHNSVGEILFIIWIILYLLLVIRLEESRSTNLKKAWNS